MPLYGYRHRFVLKTVRKGVEIYKGRQSRIQDIAIRRYQMAIGLYPTRLGYLWSFQYQQRQTEHGDCSRRTERSDGTRRAYRRFTLRRNRLVQASIRCPEYTDGKKCTLVFDGAMSHARVYINGKEAGYWPNGYNAFSVDASPFLKQGESNTLAVRLENFTESSRWYPGAVFTEMYT